MMLNSKYSSALALLLFVLPFSALAQNAGQMCDYFGETLKKGGTATIDIVHEHLTIIS